MGPGPIPWSAVKAWGEHHGFLGADFDYLWEMVSAMDHEYLSYAEDKRKKSKGKAKGGEDGDDDGNAGRVRKADGDPGGKRRAKR
jgi:hypothetical protein